MSERTIWVSSLLGADTGLPLVKIEFGDESVVIEASQARTVALNILSAAEASEQDLFVFRFFTEEMTGTVDQAAEIIRHLRQYRNALGESVPGSKP